MRHIASRSEWQEFIDMHDNFLFDMDGVLWRGQTTLAGAREAVNEVIRLGKRIFFVTNNSTKTRNDYVVKFAKLGFNGITEDMIFSSSYGAVLYLDSIAYPKIKPIFVVGGDGLREELAAAGYQSIPRMPEHRGDFTTVESICEIPLDPNVGAVICGFDGTINYIKLSVAHSYLTGAAGHPAKDEPVHFMVTNADAVYQGPGERSAMGAGALYTPLVSSTGRTPVVCGKPNPLIIELILKTHGLDPTRTCMIGDMLATDVKFGKAGKCNTMLVLSGCTTEEEATAMPSEEQPDFISSGIASLLKTTL